MKLKLPAILTIILCLFCVVTNLYWLFHQDSNPTLFIKINIATAFMLVLLVPTIQQLFKNENQEK